MCVFEGISDMGLTVCWGIHHFSLWYDILQQHILTRLVIPSLSTTQSSFSASLLTSECVQSTKINRETITWNFSAVYWSHRPKKKPFQHLKFDHFHAGSLQWNMIRVKDFWDKTPTRYKIKLFVLRPQFDVSEVES